MFGVEWKAVGVKCVHVVGTVINIHATCLCSSIHLVCMWGYLCLVLVDTVLNVNVVLNNCL